MILHSRNVAALAIPFCLFWGSRDSFGQEKTWTRQDLEQRLKAAEKPKGATPLDEVVRALFVTHTFDQVAISPDGNSVAWVETVHTKNGVLPGSTVIYVKNLKDPSRPKRISAGAADSLHAEGSVA